MDVILGVLLLSMFFSVVFIIMRSVASTIKKSSNAIQYDEALELLKESQEIDSIACNRTRAARQITFKIKRDQYLRYKDIELASEREVKEA